MVRLYQVPFVSLIGLIFGSRKTFERPFTFELAAIEIEAEKSFVVVAFDQFVRTDVPHHHRATTWGEPQEIAL